MLDKLIDLVKDCFGFFKFVAVVDQFERGLILRKGALRRMVGPGIVWYIPCKYEQLLTHPIVSDTHTLEEQTLTTMDGAGVNLTAIVIFQVHDIEQILLHVQGERQALVDSTMGVIGTQVLKSRWEEIITEEFWNEVTKKVRVRAKRYGIHIEQVMFRDLTKGRSLRLLGLPNLTQG